MGFVSFRFICPRREINQKYNDTKKQINFNTMYNHNSQFANFEIDGIC